MIDSKLRFTFSKRPSGVTGQRPIESARKPAGSASRRRAGRFRDSFPGRRTDEDQNRPVFRHGRDHAVDPAPDVGAILPDRAVLMLVSPCRPVREARRRASGLHPRRSSGAITSMFRPINSPRSNPLHLIELRVGQHDSRIGDPQDHDALGHPGQDAGLRGKFQVACFQRS